MASYTEDDWLALVKALGWRCYYCGREVSLEPCGDQTLTKDHAVPTSRSGRDTLDNLRPACLRCNRRKGGKTEIEFRRSNPILTSFADVSAHLRIPFSEKSQLPQENGLSASTVSTARRVVKTGPHCPDCQGSKWKMVPVFSEFTQQPEMRATRCKCERATLEEVLTLEDGSEFDEQLRRAAGLEPAASGQSELTFPDQKKNAGRGDTRDQSDEVLGRPA